MRKKDRNKYSLTAKQRREKREVETKETPAEGEVVAAKKFGSKQVFIIFIAVILAAVLILFAILLPLIINPYRKLSTPVAVITLNNGMKLEFEIYEDECPYASTNFIYLAKKGYFDGAIIYDMQNNFVRFGGYRDENNTHRSTDKAYTDKITDITPRENGEKFTYRLNKDSTSSSTIPSMGKEEGFLSFIYLESATEFQFCVADGSSLEVTNGDGNRRTLSSTAFARYLNTDTLELMIQLYDSVYTPNGNHVKVGKGSYYLLPENKIIIEQVKIYNLKNEKWKHFSFDNFLSSGALSYWANT